MTPLSAPVKPVLAAGDPLARPATSFAALVQDVRRTHPGGVELALIGLAPSPAYKLVRTSNGIIAILIGLLLPAVHRLVSPGNPELAVLKGAIDPGKGSISVLLVDGMLSPVAGRLPHLGYRVNMEDIIVSS